MRFKIVKGEMANIEECCEILIDSEIGRTYFTEKNPKKMLSNAFKNGNICVALNEGNECLGFILYVLDGAFQKYPYLHMIIVKKNYRGKGIGKELINFFEISVCKEYEKMFLMVGDFNIKAKRLYEKLGYKSIGIIPSFYKDGVNEHFMMKNKLEF